MGTCLFLFLQSCGYEEAYWKIMQNPMLGGRPNRGDYADAIQQLLDEHVTCFPSDRVHSKASQLAAMPHTGITIEVAGETSSTVVQAADFKQHGTAIPVVHAMVCKIITSFEDYRHLQHFLSRLVMVMARCCSILQFNSCTMTWV